MISSSAFWRLAAGLTLTTISTAALIAQRPLGAPPGTAATAAPLEVGLFRIAAAAGIPIGFESVRVADEKVSGVPKGPVSPETVERALADVLGPNSPYEWSRTADLILVRPRQGRSADLEKMAELKVIDEDLLVAADRIKDVFKHPSMPPSRFPLGGGGGLKRKVTAHGDTVLNFLNDVIGKHRQAMWVWHYNNTSAVTQRLQPAVRFRTFDQAMLSFGIEFIQ